MAQLHLGAFGWRSCIFRDFFVCVCVNACVRLYCVCVVTLRISHNCLRIAEDGLFLMIVADMVAKRESDALFRHIDSDIRITDTLLSNMRTPTHVSHTMCVSLTNCVLILVPL